MTKLHSFLASLALVCVGLAAPAQADDWILLGERKVDLSAERDTIPVNVTKTFKRIRLKVEGAPINLMDLEVHFKNGGKQDVAVKANIAAGEHTRAIDLTGPARHITHVVFVYRTKLRGRRNRVRASVKLFGLETGGEAEAPKRGDRDDKKDDKKDGPKREIEWVKLGTRKIDFGADKDVIPVTIKDGLFKRIKLKIEDNAVTIRDLKVHFANGEVADIEVKKDFKADSWTREIDLPGAVRVIQKVTVRYATKVGPRKLMKGRATLHLFGAKVEGTGSDRKVDGPGDKRPLDKGGDKRGGDWVSLGSRKVGWSVDRDEIEVTAKEGVFTKLRMGVAGNEIHLLRVRVVYGNGQDTELNPNVMVKEGTMSPALDLPGNKRIVKKVVFWYKTPGRKRRPARNPQATVTLYGKQ